MCSSKGIADTHNWHASMMVTSSLVENLLGRWLEWKSMNIVVNTKRKPSMWNRWWLKWITSMDGFVGADLKMRVISELLRDIMPNLASYQVMLRSSVVIKHTCFQFHTKVIKAAKSTSWDTFYLHGITLIPVRINIYIHYKMWKFENG